MPVAKQTKKKKGISLTPEKRKLLRQLIMQIAAEELKKQQEREAQEKKKIVESRMPPLNIAGQNLSSLEKTVRELYSFLCKLEDEKYDWECRLGKQYEEINDLNGKVSDVKGKFSKPMLKKVAKPQHKFDQDAIKRNKLFVANLKPAAKDEAEADNHAEDHGETIPAEE